MNAKPKILVTGANGQLGMELRQLAAIYSQFDFLFASREELPIDEYQKMDDYFSAYSPQFCINCAAYTAVDRAEEDDESEDVFGINADAVEILAQLCHDYGTKLVQVSTDYVFDGTARAPYRQG